MASDIHLQLTPYHTAELARVGNQTHIKIGSVVPQPLSVEMRVLKYQDVVENARAVVSFLYGEQKRGAVIEPNFKRLYENLAAAVETLNGKE